MTGIELYWYVSRLPYAFWQRQSSIFLNLCHQHVDRPRSLQITTALSLRSSQSTSSATSTNIWLMASIPVNEISRFPHRLVDFVALNLTGRRESVRSLPVSVAKIATTALPSVQLKSVGEQALVEDRLVDGRVHCEHEKLELILIV
jgi:hypothetical protein